MKRTRNKRRTTEPSRAEPVSTPEAAAAPAPSTSRSAAPDLGDGTGSYPRDLPLYTARQLANHLQVSRSTLRRMVALGQIPYIRCGKQIRFDLVAVRTRLDRAT